MSDIWLAALPWLSPHLMENLVTALALLPALILLLVPTTLAVTLLLALGVLVKNAVGSLRGFFAVPAASRGASEWAIRDTQVQGRRGTR